MIQDFSICTIGLPDAVFAAGRQCDGVSEIRRVVGLSMAVAQQNDAAVVSQEVQS